MQENQTLGDGQDIISNTPEIDPRQKYVEIRKRMDEVTSEIKMAAQAEVKDIGRLDDLYALLGSLGKELHEIELDTLERDKLELE
ncbi:MAG: hypothetical protein V4469_04070 [Patescibacteria group bacterium]